MFDAHRTDYIALPTPYAAFKAAVEEKLRPLARHEFGFYSPFGINRPGHGGVEYLLRDGRTVLGIVHRRGRGKKAPDAVVLAIFDVRGLPPAWSHHRQGGFKREDRYRFVTVLNPAPFKHMRMWADTIGLRRNVQTAVLDPQRVFDLELAPELQSMGEGLARLRWQRMDDMVTAFLPMKQGVDGKGNRAAAQLRADNRRREALVNPPGDRNWLAAGIVQGLNNATRTQQFWNARAAEAQARYFHAQHGCRPGFCGGGGNDGGDRDRNDRDRNDGNGGRRRDADVARASATAASGRPNAAQTASTSGGHAGTAGGASPSGAGGGGAASPQLTHYVTGQYAKAGTEAQACTAAKSMTALKSEYRDKLTGKVADRCVCTNPGATLQRMVDNDRRKRDEATEQWIKDQYTSAIQKREEKIRTEGWSCHADFEVYGSSGSVQR